MNEFLRKFDTIRFITPWSIFRNFLGIFHFLNSNLKFEFWPVGYRPEPEPDRFPPVRLTLGMARRWGARPAPCTCSLHRLGRAHSWLPTYRPLTFASLQPSPGLARVNACRPQWMHDVEMARETGHRRASDSRAARSSRWRRRRRRSIGMSHQICIKRRTSV